MSNIAQTAGGKVKAAFYSGGPGTTGREPFEESTATGPAPQFTAQGQNSTSSSAGQGSHGSHNTSSGAPSSGYGSGLTASGAGQGTQYGDSKAGTAGSGANTSAATGAGATGTGPATGVAAGAGGMGGSGTTPSGQYGHIAPTSAAAHSQGTGNTGVHGHHSHEGGGHIAGITAGTAAGAGAAGASSHISNASSQPTGTGYPTDRSSHGAGTAGLGGGQNAVGGETNQTSGHGLGGQSGQTGSHVDRVGALGQDQALYERTGDKGPISSGAAGTDRFDSTGKTGSTPGQYADGVQQDTSGPRAPEKSTGGVAGVLATSDKDFTGRDRLGSGAYTDTHGPFKTNTSGPGGNTALTGREGTPENNPVHRANTKDSAGTTKTDESGEKGEKKGFMQKVKDALKDV